MSSLLVELGLMYGIVVGTTGPIVCHHYGQNWRYCVSLLIVILGLLCVVVVG